MIIPNDILLSEVSDLVAERKPVKLKVKGNSMLPFIKGDCDSVLLVFPEELKVFDVVLARLSTGNYVLHRILDIDGEHIKLMGDGNVNGCEYCKRHDVKAVAVKVYSSNVEEVDITTPRHLRKVKIWYMMLPWRRYLLAIYRRLFSKII